MPLQREGRFSRSYHSDERNVSCGLSRFMDGSASMSLSELERTWKDWTKEDQIDFCQSCRWLFEQTDFPDMLRFIMKHGGPEHWSGIALMVADYLPAREAFEMLTEALNATEIGKASNISQGIAQIKDPRTEGILRNHLSKNWQHPKLWDNADFINWVAFDATTCIAHLIKFGASPADFIEQTRLLARHECARNRESCRNFLSKHYPEINFSN